MIAVEKRVAPKPETQAWQRANGYVISLIILIYSISIGWQLGLPVAGDEIRYLDYARNLLHGTYALAQDGGIRNGPGYPLLLAPLVALGIPDPWLRLANLPLVLFGLGYVYLTIAMYTSRRTARLTTVLLAFYPPLLLSSGQLMTEAFGLLLFAGFSYHFLTWQRSDRGGGSQAILASVHLGLLALTKVAFGYVVVGLLVLVVCARFIPRLYRRIVRRGAVECVCVLAFLFCVPYLMYTYTTTSKGFYWGTNSGENLYWMTVTGPKMWGSWIGPQTARESPGLSDAQRDFLEHVSSLNPVERDEAYQREFTARLVANPQVYLWNWVSNVARLLFNYPYSQRQQSLFTYGYLAPNMLIVFLLIASSYPAIQQARDIDGELLVLGLVCLIYAGLISIVSVTSRHLIVVMPFGVLWLAYIFSRFVRIRIDTFQ